MPIPDTAFPLVLPDDEDSEVLSEGITPRDYFAAAAMNGLLASFSFTVTDETSLPQIFRAKKLVEASWGFADAMLIQREL